MYTLAADPIEHKDWDAYFDVSKEGCERLAAGWDSSSGSLEVNDCSTLLGLFGSRRNVSCAKPDA